jgi:hypothetical protein
MSRGSPSDIPRGASLRATMDVPERCMPAMQMNTPAV